MKVIRVSEYQQENHQNIRGLKLIAWHPDHLIVCKSIYLKLRAWLLASKNIF